MSTYPIRLRCNLTNDDNRFTLVCKYVDMPSKGNKKQSDEYRVHDNVSNFERGYKSNDFAKRFSFVEATVTTPSN